MKYLIYFAIGIFAIISTSAQVDRSVYYSYGTQFYTEHHLSPENTPDSLNVIVFYNIMYDALAFIKEISDNSDFVYKATAKIEITFKDESGIIRNRAFNSDSLTVNDYNETNSKDIFHNGALITKLPTGNYEAKLTIYEGKNSLYENKFDIKGKNYYSEPNISKPIFCYQDRETGDKSFIPMALDYAMSFNKENVHVLFSKNFIEKPDDINFSIEKSQENDNNYWKNDFNYSGRALRNDNSKFCFKNSIFEITSCSTDLATSFSTFQIKLPSKQMTPGKYFINYKSDNGFTHKDTFEVKWLNMPLSLDNPDYAVDMMYYILTDEEFKLMDKGENTEKISKLSDYWSKHDPTPETPFNEAMIEYFGRVDFAYFNYQTIKEKDGAKTQRGKIYILFGSPDEVKNELNDGNAREIWIYNKVKKIFIFENTSPGVYELSEVKDI